MKEGAMNLFFWIPFFETVNVLTKIDTAIQLPVDQILHNDSNATDWKTEAIEPQTLENFTVLLPISK